MVTSGDRHTQQAGRLPVRHLSWSTPWDHPAGLPALVVADSPADIRLWVPEANRLRVELPAQVKATLQRHQEAGTTDSAEFVDRSVAGFVATGAVCGVLTPTTPANHDRAPNSDPIADAASAERTRGRHR